MSAIASVVFLNYGGFSGGIKLSNLAYEVALSIRQAQVYGINVREAGGSFSAGYGIHFSSADPSKYILFVDTNGNFNYDGGETIIETFILQGGYTFSSVCADSDCLPSVDYVDVVFKRPDPDAHFKTSSGSSYSIMKIEITSSDGTTKKIKVGITGYVSID